MSVNLIALYILYRSSYYKDPERSQHRVAWLRLVPHAVALLSWAKTSALPPCALVTALQTAQIEPAIELLYPALGKRITAVLLVRNTTRQAN